jgi:hypothetical protein
MVAALPPNRDRGGTSRLLPSHTTGRTGHVSGGSADSIRMIGTTRLERLFLACQRRVHPRGQAEPDLSPDAILPLHVR